MKRRVVGTMGWEYWVGTDSNVHSHTNVGRDMCSVGMSCTPSTSTPFTHTHTPVLWRNKQEIESLCTEITFTHHK